VRPIPERLWLKSGLFLARGAQEKNNTEKQIKKKITEMNRRSKAMQETVPRES